MDLKIISAENGSKGHYVLVPIKYDDVVTRMCLEERFIRVDVIPKEGFLEIGPYQNMVYAKAQRILILRAIRAQNGLDQKKEHTMSEIHSSGHPSSRLRETARSVRRLVAVILLFLRTHLTNSIQSEITSINGSHYLQVHKSYKELVRSIFNDDTDRTTEKYITEKGNYLFLGPLDSRPDAVLLQNTINRIIDKKQQSSSEEKEIQTSSFHLNVWAVWSLIFALLSVPVVIEGRYNLATIIHVTIAGVLAVIVYRSR